jgi:DASS family divalent anion:Na+ symporter
VLDAGVGKGPVVWPSAALPPFFSAITPQGSSANLLFAGSGYLTQGELYRIGAISTAFSLLVYVVIGVPWLMLVAR